MWDDFLFGDMYFWVDWKWVEFYCFEYERYEDVNKCFFSCFCNFGFDKIY